MKSKRIIAIVILAGFLLNTASVGATPSQADPPPRPPDPAMLEQYVQDTFTAPAEQAMILASNSPVLVPDLLAKAEPDECYNGIGQAYTGTVPTCDYYPYSKPKVNQAYVWGMVQSEDDVWFGTAPNTHCLVLGTAGLIPFPFETPSYVCEFGDSQYSPPAPASLGDWRPPEAYLYDTVSESLYNVSPISPTQTITDVNRFNNTVGIRSAGLISDTIFLAGPNLGVPQGINLFAYDAESGDFLDSTTLTDYANIRKWVEVDGVLYTGVKMNNALGGGGAVLRYSGDPADPDRRFEFEEVGVMNTEAAELALHDGRLFVSTWPNLATYQRASLWMSPPIPPGGLTGANKDQWQKVWDIAQYETDPLTAQLTGGGALASFDGELYWGTMHVPFVSAMAHLNQYPPDPGWSPEMRTAYIMSTLLGSHRAISIFRGDDFGTPQQNIEILYGEQFLPTFVPPLGAWILAPNNMNIKPLFGSSGFGNFYNNYTWAMGVFQEELYLGTMDWSYLMQDGLTLILAAMGLPPGAVPPMPGASPGADLYRFSSKADPAEPIFLDGADNFTSYGVRNMITGDSFYLGMANPMNLLTNPSDGLPEGGWELIEMLALPPGPDLKIDKTVDSAVLTPGEVFSYTLTVTNQSIGPASGVEVTDVLPPEVSYDDASPGCTEFDSVVTCDLGDLAGSSSTSVQIQVIAPGQGTGLVNWASVWSNEQDQDPSDNVYYFGHVVDQATDLSISKSASPEAIFQEQALTYTLNVMNLGPDDVAPETAFSFNNPDSIFIPGFGPAYPYPASIRIRGLSGQVSKVTVTLHDLNHTFPDDLDILLVGPSGQMAKIMSDAGGGFNLDDVTLTLDDEAAIALPDSTQIISGTYRATDYAEYLFPDIFLPPAPVGSGSAGSELAVFNGQDPNGVWQLFITDDNMSDAGNLMDGWTLTITTERAVSVTVSDDLPKDVTLSDISAPGWNCQEVFFRKVRCTMDRLPANIPYPITLVTTVSPTAQWTFTNVATIHTDTHDPEAGNDSDQAVVGSWNIALPLILVERHGD